jgi:hypothetical protein
MRVYMLLAVVGLACAAGPASAGSIPQLTSTQLLELAKVGSGSSQTLLWPRLLTHHFYMSPQHEPAKAFQLWAVQHKKDYALDTASNVRH